MAWISLCFDSRSARRHAGKLLYEPVERSVTPALDDLCVTDTVKRGR